MQVGIGTTTLTGAMTYTGGTRAGRHGSSAPGRRLPSGSARTLNGGAFPAPRSIRRQQPDARQPVGHGRQPPAGRRHAVGSVGPDVSRRQTCCSAASDRCRPRDGAGRLISDRWYAGLHGGRRSQHRVRHSHRCGGRLGAQVQQHGREHTVHPTSPSTAAPACWTSRRPPWRTSTVCVGLRRGRGHQDRLTQPRPGSTARARSSPRQRQPALFAGCADASGTPTAATALIVTPSNASIGSNSVDYSAASGGVYTDLGAQTTRHAPAGEGWSSSAGPRSQPSTSPVSRMVTGSSFADVLAAGGSSSTRRAGPATHYYVHNAATR